MCVCVRERERWIDCVYEFENFSHTPTDKSPKNRQIDALRGQMQRGLGPAIAQARQAVVCIEQELESEGVCKWKIYCETELAKKEQEVVH